MIYWYMTDQLLLLFPAIFSGNICCKNSMIHYYYNFYLFICYVCVLFCTDVRDASVCVGPFLSCDSHVLKTPSACQFHFFVMLEHARSLPPCTCFLNKKKKPHVPLIPARPSHLSLSFHVYERRRRKKQISSWSEHLNIVSFVSVLLLVRWVWITEKKRSGTG